MSVICDYLDVTLPPGSVTFDAVSKFFDNLPGTWRAESGVHSFRHSEDSASFKFQSNPKWQRLSASGRVLMHFRAQGIFLDYLAAISEVPHNVTRLDAALDLNQSGPDVIPALHHAHRSGFCGFGRKAIPVRATLMEGSEGLLTGSVMFGDRRRHKLSAIVYDKQHEALEKRGEVLPPRVRYELRANREVGCTLRDAADPAPFFYAHMAPTFVSAPESVPSWAPFALPWSASPAPPRLPADRAASLVASCGDLEALAALAREIGPEGVPYVLRLVRKRLELLSADPCTAPLQ